MGNLDTSQWVRPLLISMMSADKASGGESTGSEENDYFTDYSP